MLDVKQLDYYDLNGYLSIEGVFSKTQIDALSDVTDQFVEKSRSVIEEDDIFGLESDHSSENPRLTRIKNPHKVHSVYEDIMRDNSLLDILQDLIGIDIRLQATKLNMKMPEGGRQIEWHTDWGHYPHTNDDLLAVGVPLDNATEENGCMLVIPGSHKWREISHHQDGYFVGAVNSDHIDMGKAVPMTMNTGAISIHHVRTLHASAPNLSENPRRLLLLSYGAVDAFPLTGLGMSWDDWNKQIVRGRPTFQPRLERLPVFFPQPRKSGNTNIFQVQSDLKKSHFS